MTRLSKAARHLGEEREAIHCIFNGRIIGQMVNRLTEQRLDGNRHGSLAVISTEQSI